MIIILRYIFYFKNYFCILSDNLFLTYNSTYYVSPSLMPNTRYSFVAFFALISTLLSMSLSCQCIEFSPVFYLLYHSPYFLILHYKRKLDDLKKRVPYIFYNRHFPKICPCSLNTVTFILCIIC